MEKFVDHVVRMGEWLGRHPGARWIRPGTAGDPHTVVLPDGSRDSHRDLGRLMDRLEEAERHPQARTA